MNFFYVGISQITFNNPRRHPFCKQETSSLKDDEEIYI